MTRCNVALIVVAIVLGLLSVARGQDVKPPVLAELAILKLSNAAKDAQLTQLRAALAVQSFQEAQQRLQQTIKMYTIDGYTINLETMKYEPIVTEKK